MHFLSDLVRGVLKPGTPGNRRNPEENRTERLPDAGRLGAITQRSGPTGPAERVFGFMQGRNQTQAGGSRNSLLNSVGDRE